MTTHPEEFLPDSVSLVKEESALIRDLAGFRKGHQVPKEANEHTRNFVARIAADDLSEDLDDRFSAFRKLLKFRRADLQVTEPQCGVGRISTPWFDYQVSVSLSVDDVSAVIWRRQVAEIRKPHELFSSAFSLVFGKLFDTIELVPSEAIDLTRFIDQVENLELSSVSLEYDRSVSWCHVTIHGVPAEMRLTPGHVALTVTQPHSPDRLLEAFFSVRSRFAGIGCF